MRKTQDGLVITLNKTNGDISGVKGMLQGERTLRLYEGVTEEVILPSSTRRRVIKKVNTKLSNAEIKNQLKKNRITTVIALVIQDSGSSSCSSSLH